MSRPYAVLLASLGVAWAAMTVATIPDCFPEEADPYGYGLLIAHGVIPSFAVPVALVARVRRRSSTAQTAKILAVPLVGFVLVALAWTLAGLPSDGLEIVIASGTLYLILGVLWWAVIGLDVGTVRLLSRWTAA